MSFKLSIYKSTYGKTGLQCIGNGLVKREGGEGKSSLLREYYKKYRNMEVGLYSYGCFYYDFNPWGREIRIGRYCSFAGGIKVLSNNMHNVKALTTSPLLGQHVNIEKEGPLEIGNDVWVGENVMITPKVHHIGTGVVLAAGSVLTHDAEPYGIYAGSPAVLLRKRFSEETIERLLKSGWWECTPEELPKKNKELLP